MLTEHMSDALRDAPEELQKEWLASYAEHLCRKYKAAQGEAHRADPPPADDGRWSGPACGWTIRRVTKANPSGSFECKPH